MPKKIFEVNNKINGPLEEAYKTLRANLQFYELDRKLNTISVTSCNPGEGKTTTSLNLAIIFARTGMNVLYVDADLRKPMLMKNLGTDDFKGLSNYLSGHAVLDEIINPTNIEGFYFIACGLKPVNPAEMLGSERFNSFIKAVCEQFDLVIFDTPPLGSVIDGAIVSSKADGTIIVIEAGKVRLNNALSVKEQLVKANARILGVVLNKVGKIDYRNYYSNYDYYGEQKRYVKRWVKKY
jgi:capsular exopolysaccharide synthesis family protein